MNWMLRICVVAAAVSVIGGCGGKGEEKHISAIVPNVALLHDSTLAPGAKMSPADVDSMRALKVRLGVTRDEYWEGKGGVLANEWCEVWYPTGSATVTHGMYTLRQLNQARNFTGELFGRVPQEKLVVECSVTMERYTEQTGRMWWHYALTEGDVIALQPVAVLHARGLLEIAIPHEYFKWALGKLTGGHAPLWIVEGFASVASFEGAVLLDQVEEFPNAPLKMSQEEIDEHLAKQADRQGTRMACYNAYRMVKHVVDTHGRPKFKTFINALGRGSSLDEASREGYGMKYDELLVFAAGWDPSGVR